MEIPMDMTDIIGQNSIHNHCKPGIIFCVGQIGNISPLIRSQLKYTVGIPIKFNTNAMIQIVLIGIIGYLKLQLFLSAEKHKILGSKIFSRGS